MSKIFYTIMITFYLKHTLIQRKDIWTQKVNTVINIFQFPLKGHNDIRPLKIIYFIQNVLKFKLDFPRINLFLLYFIQQCLFIKWKYPFLKICKWDLDNSLWFIMTRRIIRQLLVNHILINYTCNYWKSYFNHNEMHQGIFIQHLK